MRPQNVHSYFTLGNNNIESKQEKAVYYEV